MSAAIFFPDPPQQMRPWRVRPYERYRGMLCEKELSYCGRIITDAIKSSHPQYIIKHIQNTIAPTFHKTVRGIVENIDAMTSEPLCNADMAMATSVSTLKLIWKPCSVSEFGPRTQQL